MTTKYKLQAKYPTFYANLEQALEFYASENDLTGFRYQTDSGSYKYSAIANHVFEFCDKTFDYLPVHLDRVIHFLQGVGLNIEIYNDKIYEMMYKDGTLLRTDTDTKHLRFLENYWKFMAMRLKNIAASKN